MILEITRKTRIAAVKATVKGAKKKAPTLSFLEKKLDRYFSTVARRSRADEGGTVQCVTCGVLKHWKETDAGHFIKRQYRSVRWTLTNVHPQCFRCNHFQDGRQDDYANYIIKTYGQDEFNFLMSRKYEIVKYGRYEIELLINTYKLLAESYGRD